MLRLLALRTSGGRTVSQKMVKNYIPDARSSKNKKEGRLMFYCILYTIFKGQQYQIFEETRHLKPLKLKIGVLKSWYVTILSLGLESG